MLFTTQRYFSSMNHTIDNSIDQALIGEHREVTGFTMGLRRMFPWGMRVESSVIRTKNTAEDVAITIPNAGGGQATLTSDVTDTETNLKLAIQQSMWRNFLSREVSLQQEVAKISTISPEYAKKIHAQTIQAETENLYWQYVNLNAKIDLSKALVDLSRRFRDSMKKRMDLGRADEVDVASAESNLIDQEEKNLNLSIFRDQVNAQFSIRLFGKISEVHVRASFPEFSLIKLPVSNSYQAVAYAFKNRYDLRMLRDQKAALQGKVELAKEKGKPDLSLFASVESQVLDSEERADKEIFNNKTYTVGLKFEMPLGGTSSRTDKESALAEISLFTAKEELIKREVLKGLAAAYESLRGADRQLRMAENNIETLKKKEKSEQIKVNQARSDLVAVLRYKIEVLVAILDRIEALKNRAEAEAKIRFLIHGYSIERS